MIINEIKSRIDQLIPKTQKTTTPQWPNHRLPSTVLPSATGPVAAEDPDSVYLAAGQVGEPPSQGRGGTQAPAALLPLASLLPRPASGGGHVQVAGVASGVLGHSSESSNLLPLLQGQALRPVTTRAVRAHLPPISPGLSVPAYKCHCATPPYTHLALIWPMEPPAPILTSIAVTGPWDLRRSPSLQESGDDGRSRVTRPGEAHCALNTGGCTAHSMHYTLHMAYLTTQCEVQAVKKVHCAHCTVHTTPQYAQHVFSMSKITFPTFNWVMLI